MYSMSAMNRKWYLDSHFSHGLVLEDRLIYLYFQTDFTNKRRIRITALGSVTAVLLDPHPFARDVFVSCVIHSKWDPRKLLL